MLEDGWLYKDGKAMPERRNHGIAKHYSDGEKRKMGEQKGEVHSGITR